MKLTFLTTSLASVVLLSACGGGGSAAPAPSPTPTPTPSTAVISGVSNDALKYGSVAKFSVSGTNLDSGLTFSSPGCANPVMLAGATPVLQVWSCTPTQSGALVVAVSAKNVANPTIITPNVPVPRVTMKTSIGGVAQADIVIELNPNKAPLTVANFIQYANTGYYDDKIFHRVLSGFMIQGGGFKAGALTPSATVAPIALESGNGLLNTRGTIAMARTPARDSATSQFFINLADNAFLNAGSASDPNGYAVFGTVLSGMAAVDAIAAVAVAKSDISEAQPISTVQITSVTQTQ